jgi:hypothetical protein
MTDTVTPANVETCAECDDTFDADDTVEFKVRDLCNSCDAPQPVAYCKNHVAEARQRYDVAPPWPERLVGIVDTVSGTRTVVDSQQALRDAIKDRPSSDFTFVVFHGQDTDDEARANVWKHFGDGAPSATKELLQKIWTETPDASLSLALAGHDVVGHRGVPATWSVDGYTSADEFYDIVVAPRLRAHNPADPDAVSWMVTHAHIKSPVELTVWAHWDASVGMTACATLADVAAACTDKLTVDVGDVVWYDRERQVAKVKIQHDAAVDALMEASAAADDDVQLATLGKRKRAAADEYDDAVAAKRARLAETVPLAEPWQPTPDDKFAWLCSAT